MNRTFARSAVFTTFALLAAAACLAGPPSSKFTLQGRLRDGGMPASGAYNATFRIFDADTGGTELAAPVLLVVTAEAGLFTAVIDFGGDPLLFNGDPRFIEMTVGKVGSGTPVTLDPRIEITRAPLATNADQVTLPLSQTSDQPGTTFGIENTSGDPNSLTARFANVGGTALLAEGASMLLGPVTLGGDPNDVISMAGNLDMQGSKITNMAGGSTFTDPGGLDLKGDLTVGADTDAPANTYVRGELWVGPDGDHLLVAGSSFGVQVDGVPFSVGSGGIPPGVFSASVNGVSSARDFRVYEAFFGKDAFEVDSFTGNTTAHGYVEPKGGILDAAMSLGAAGQILSSTGTGVKWQDQIVGPLDMKTFALTNVGGATFTDGTNPTAQIDGSTGNASFDGQVECKGGLLDEALSLGSEGQYLCSTGAGVKWCDPNVAIVQDLDMKGFKITNMAGGSTFSDPGGLDLKGDLVVGSDGDAPADAHIRGNLWVGPEGNWRFLVLPTFAKVSGVSFQVTDPTDKNVFSAGIGGVFSSQSVFVSDGTMTKFKVDNATGNTTTDGYVEPKGGIRDVGMSLGAAGQILSSTGTGVKWQDQIVGPLDMKTFALTNVGGATFTDGTNPTAQIDGSTGQASFEGSVEPKGGVLDEAMSLGTEGQVLRSSGNGVVWSDPNFVVVQDLDMKGFKITNMAGGSTFTDPGGLELKSDLLVGTDGDGPADARIRGRLYVGPDAQTYFSADSSFVSVTGPSFHVSTGPLSPPLFQAFDAGVFCGRDFGVGDIFTGDTFEVDHDTGNTTTKGNVEPKGGIKDVAMSLGTPGQVLSSTGAGVVWVDCNCGGSQNCICTSFVCTGDTSLGDDSSDTTTVIGTCTFSGNVNVNGNGSWNGSCVMTGNRPSTGVIDCQNTNSSGYGALLYNMAGGTGCLTSSINGTGLFSDATGASSIAGYFYNPLGRAQVCQNASASNLQPAGQFQHDGLGSVIAATSSNTAVSSSSTVFAQSSGVNPILTVQNNSGVNSANPVARIVNASQRTTLVLSSLFGLGLQFTGGAAGSGNTSFTGTHTQNGDMNVSGTVSKGGGTFKIDHPLDPENKYLQHSFVESPDMMNIYNGNVVTDARGYAVVELPAWFDALNRDFRYQLTVVDETDSDWFVQAKVVQKIADNAFTIRTSAPRVEVSWQVTGIRQDPFANTNRVQVELAKPASERGKYLHPEAWGLPAELGVMYDEQRRLAEAAETAAQPEPELPPLPRVDETALPDGTIIRAPRPAVGQQR